MNNVIICDLDGTLFDVSDRLKILLNCRNEHDYDVFHQAHINDKLYKGVADIIRHYIAMNEYLNKTEIEITKTHIIYVTGRHIKFMGSTINQLIKNYLWTEDCEIRMKSSYKDYTIDFIQKQIDDIIEQYSKDKIMFVLDDRPATVELYRKAGLLCLQTQNSKGFIEDVKKDNINK